MNDNEIRLGYACINTELNEFNVLTSRTLKLKTAHEKGLDYIKKLATDNVEDLLKILIYNEAHGIRFFRITSCLFPHLGNPQLQNSDYAIDFVKDKLKIIGKFAKENNHRLTMHPGQYVQLGSLDNNVVKNSIVDIINHVLIFKYMNCTPNDGSVLIIHGGGTFGDRQQTLDRWKNNFNRLPDAAKQYIVLENDENNYGVNHLLPFCEENNIPFCLDVFHNNISKDKVSITDDLIIRILNTWKKRNIIPKMHLSTQQEDLRRGAHSKTLDIIPFSLLHLPFKFNTKLDIMLEVKDKEVSVFKMYKKYFNIKMNVTGKVFYTLKKKVMRKIDKKKSN